MLKRRTLISGSGPGPVSSSNSKPLDVVFCNNETEELVIISGGEDYWPDKDEYTPIGIVIVPGTHNRYHDGSCGVASLNNASTEADTGDAYSGFDYWLGPFYHTGYEDYTVSTPYSLFSANADNIGYTMPESARSGEYLGTRYLSYSWFPGAYPYQIEYGEGGTDYYPSFIKSSTDYQVEELAKNGISIGDFNGIRNTLGLLCRDSSYVFRESYSYLNPEYDFSNEKDTSRSWFIPYLAARYTTKGTEHFFNRYKLLSNDGYLNGLSDWTIGTTQSSISNTKTWYLPAYGEIAYIPPVYKSAEEVLKKIKNKYGVNVTGFYKNKGIWSSTCNDGDGIGMLKASDCIGASAVGEDSEIAMVRPFMRL